jgi:SUN domain-containing protein 1/2
MIWSLYFGPIFCGKLFHSTPLGPPQPETDSVSRPSSRNFALQVSGTGAQDISILTSPSYGNQNSRWGFFLLNRQPSGPSVVLQENPFTSACWAFPGASGHYGVALDRVVNITQISVTYRPPSSIIDSTKAPRSMILWGLAEGTENVRTFTRSLGHFSFPTVIPSFHRALPNPTEPIAWAPIVHLTYDITQNNLLQVFDIPDKLKNLGISYGIVVLQVLDNWGSQESTSLCGFGVYGTAM